MAKHHQFLHLFAQWIKIEEKNLKIRQGAET
jgi:hypothetical protein